MPHSIYFELTKALPHREKVMDLVLSLMILKGVVSMNSLTANSDSECLNLAQQRYDKPVTSHQDVNHYSKELMKDLEELALLHPTFEPVMPVV